MLTLLIVYNIIDWGEIFAKWVFNIFVDSHKIISIKIYENIFDIYGVKLDKEKLLWGSICPDILPKYKLVRHY